MRRSTILPAAVALTAAACGPLPLATPGPGELPALSARVQRSRTDVESVLRLAAGLWSQGDRDGARALLEEARAAVPEEPIFLAALALTDEGVGQFDAARDHYLGFLAATRPSDVTPAIVTRTTDLRRETAAPLVRRLLQGDLSLEHGRDPGFVAAVVPFEAPGNDVELTRLAAAATDLLVLELRDRDYDVLDWEVTAAALDAIDPTTAGPDADARTAALLGAGRVVRVTVGRLANGGVVFRVAVLRVLESQLAVESDSLETTLAEYGTARGALTHLVWEMTLGAPRGSTPADFYPDPEPLDLPAVLTLGQALIAYSDGDRLQAQSLLASAPPQGAAAPAFTDRLRQLESLEELRTSPTMPLADELVTLARRQVLATALLRDVAAPPLGSSRHGISEVFGLDRLGAQVFADIIFVPSGSQQ